MMSKHGKETTNHFGIFREVQNMNVGLDGPPKKKRRSSSDASSDSENDKKDKVTQRKVFDIGAERKIVTDKDLQIHFR